MYRIWLSGFALRRGITRSSVPLSWVDSCIGADSAWPLNCEQKDVRLHILLFASITAFPVLAADARHGQEMLHELSCLECHTVQGVGQRVGAAPDLGQRVQQLGTPAAVASALWNHTPSMWNEMSARVVARPLATDDEWRDVMTYLWSLGLMNNPADAKRGTKVFEEKRCGSCHKSGGSGFAATVAPQVAVWNVAEDPFSLLEGMWNHAGSMQREFAARHWEWQKLTGRDLMDLTAFVGQTRTQPATFRAGFSIPDGELGRAAFEARCASCHTGGNSLTAKLKTQSWMDIGAAMWNHAPLMKKAGQTPPSAAPGEMRLILAYVWDLQHRDGEAVVARGRELFTGKRCAECHQGSPRPGQNFTPYSMIALGWGPGRLMHKQMSAKGIPWPYLSTQNMADLTAWLNSQATN